MLAAPAAAERLPGTGLAFGVESSQFGATQGFQPASRALPEDQQAREGTLRFFGIESHATLLFKDRRLSGAEFVIENISPRQLAYVRDDLTRRGYRKRCMSDAPGSLDCEWFGRTRVAIKVLGTRLEASVTSLDAPEGEGRDAPAVADDPAERGAPAGSGDAMAWAQARLQQASAEVGLHPDTLRIGPELSSPEVLVGPPAEVPYPAAARRAGVQGIVRLLALVDTSGVVVETRIIRSIAELDTAAIEIARGLRFRPFFHDNRCVRAWVEMPVTFTIH